MRLIDSSTFGFRDNRGIVLSISGFKQNVPITFFFYFHYVVFFIAVLFDCDTFYIHLFTVFFKWHKWFVSYNHGLTIGYDLVGSHDFIYCSFSEATVLYSSRLYMHFSNIFVGPPPSFEIGYTYIYFISLLTHNFHIHLLHCVHVHFGSSFLFLNL